MKLDWKKLFKMNMDEKQVESRLEKLIKQYSEVFEEGLGKLRNFHRAKGQDSCGSGCCTKILQNTTGAICLERKDRGRT